MLPAPHLSPGRPMSRDAVLPENAAQPVLDHAARENGASRGLLSMAERQSFSTVFSTSYSESNDVFCGITCSWLSPSKDIMPYTTSFGGNFKLNAFGTSAGFSAHTRSISWFGLWKSLK